MDVHDLAVGTDAPLGRMDMPLRKKLKDAEVVLYNFDLRKQELSLLYRGEEIPKEYRGYQRLWRLCDKHRKIETIIISI